MITCDTFKKRRGAYLHGELPPDQRVLFDKHMETCGACRVSLDKLSRLASILSTVKIPPVPAGLAGRVMAAARVQVAQKWNQTASNPLEWWRTVSVPMRAATAAMLLMGLMTGVVMGWNSSLPETQSGQAISGIPEDLFGQYTIDVMGDMPRGSLADAFFTLASGTDREGQ